jgi:hypothetical protein
MVCLWLFLKRILFLQVKNKTHPDCKNVCPFIYQLTNVDPANAKSANTKSANAESANVESANAESQRIANHPMSNQAMPSWCR